MAKVDPLHTGVGVFVSSYGGGGRAGETVEPRGHTLMAAIPLEKGVAGNDGAELYEAVDGLGFGGGVSAQVGVAFPGADAEVALGLIVIEGVGAGINGVDGDEGPIENALGVGSFRGVGESEGA